ncbi:MAG: hypothetical protein ACRD8W_04195 [Nitrososphaeraceae archaeon]
MKTLMKRLQAAEDRLNLELENAHGEFGNTKAVLQKRIDLYGRYEMEDDITELERLMLSNKREWNMAHLLGLIEHEDMINKISELAKRVYELEKKMSRLEEYH